MRPTGDIALAVERRGQLMVAEWAVPVVLQVVLARKDHLDRLAREFREPDGLGDEIVLEAPAEPAADAGHRYVDVEPVDSGDPACDVRCAAGALHRRDDRDPVGLHMCARILGLERAVRDIGHAVRRSDDARSFTTRAIEVAIVTDAPARTLEQRGALRIERGSRFL